MGSSSGMIHGITVKLITLTEDGVDGFNNPTYSVFSEDVVDVLVSPSSSDDIVDSTNLYGKKAIYTIAIPKGDTHVWADNFVEFFGQRWHVFSYPMEGIEANIPLRWNAKYYVERYEVSDQN